MTVKLQTLDLKHDHYMHDVYRITDVGRDIVCHAKIKDRDITTIVTKKDFFITIVYEG